MSAALRALMPRRRHVPPDAPAGWIVVASAFFVYLVAVGLQYVTGIFFRGWVLAPTFAGTPPATLAWATSLEATFFLLGSPIGGKSVVACGAARTVLLGAAFILVGSLAAAAIDVTDPSASLGSLCVFFGVTLGSGCAIAHVAAVVAVQAFFRKRRGLATGVVVAGSGVGAWVLGPLLEALVVSLGWRQALAIYGALAASVCACAAGVIAIFRVEDEPSAQDVAAAAAAPPAADGAKDAEAVSLASPAAAPGAPGAHAPPPSAAVAAATPDWAASKRSLTAVYGSSSSSSSSEKRTKAVPATIDEEPVPLSDQLEPSSNSGGGGSDAPTEAPSGAAAASSQAAPPPPAQPHAVPPPPARPLSYRQLVTSRFFVTYAAFICFYALCWFTVPTYLPVTVTERLGGSSGDVSGVVAAQGVANTVGRVALGVAVDAFPHRKMGMLTGCMAAVSVASLAFTLSTSLPYAFVYGAVLGGAGGSIVSLFPGIVIDALGLPSLPLAQGAINAVQAPWALCGPPIGGALRTATGSYAGTWAFVTAGFTAAAALSLNVAIGREGTPWREVLLPRWVRGGGSTLLP
jgi:MFS family permease